MGHKVVACIDLRHLHILTSNPSLMGAIGLCSSKWAVSWKLMHGLAYVGFSVTACTSWSLFPSSSSTFLARVDNLAFISMSSESA